VSVEIDVVKVFSGKATFTFEQENKRGGGWLSWA
jgi:hypothetical protein